jgi:hypothetical protein
LRGQKPDPENRQTTYIQPKEGKANPTRKKPVKKPNAKK